MDGLKTITILKAARLRIELGGFSELECLCARGEGLKGPKPIDAIYCPMCAIEASQITAGVHNSFHGAAMIELVADVADDLAQDVFQGDDAHEAAVLVHHHGHVDAGVLHLAQ